MSHLSAEEIKYVLTQDWVTIFNCAGQQWIYTYRSNMLRFCDGDGCAPLSRWPPYIRRILFQTIRPIGDRQTFQLMLFFIGNGFPPLKAGKWILTSHTHCARGKEGTVWLGNEFVKWPGLLKTVVTIKIDGVILT